MSTVSDLQPRLISRADAATYCGLTLSGFDDWVRSGRLPKALAGTRRWDRKAIDAALDRLSGLAANDDGMSDYQRWKASARSATGHKQGSAAPR
jgi:predicted DNA-binding transcriptional regulator AlpA